MILQDALKTGVPKKRIKKFLEVEEYVYKS